MKIVIMAMLAAAAAAGCNGEESAAPQLSQAGPAKTILQNSSFDEGSSGEGIAGWEKMGEAFGRAELVRTANVSPPHAAMLTPIGKGSGGNDSFMLFQTLDHNQYRGRRLRFGARVRTKGAGVNVVLYTPERSANTFDSNVNVPEFSARDGVLDVPKNASYLSFGIQVLGPVGSTAWVDDAFVTPVDAAAAAPPPRNVPTALPSTATAQVTVDASKPGPPLNHLVFGMHVEWIDNANGLMEKDRHALRTEVVDALKSLRIPLFRYPGGILADYYDWKRGIGPPERRGRMTNIYNQQSEPHGFGTDEFLALLRATDAEGLITLNYGTGTPQMAGEWAEYLARATPLVMRFEVGNEIYLSGPKATGPNSRAIYRTAEEYAKDFPRYKTAVLQHIPNAQVGAIAHLESGAFNLAPSDNLNWSRDMLKALTTKADFIAVHNAYAPVLLYDVDFSQPQRRQAVYQSMLASAGQTADNLEELGRMIASLSPINRDTPFAVTEFGPFFGLSSKLATHNAYVDQSRTMAAALYTASVLDVLIGHPRVILAAYTNPIHRWFGVLLTDTDRELVKTPTYYLYSLYRTRFEDTLVDVGTSSPTFDAPTEGIGKGRKNVPDLLTRASISGDRRGLTAMLVNRSLDRTLETKVNVRGFVPKTVDCQVLAGQSAASINGPALTSTTMSGTPVVPRSHSCTTGSEIRLQMPPSAIVSLVAVGQ